MLHELTDLRRRLLGIDPSQSAPDHYQLLGVGRLELSVQVLTNAAERQLQHLKRCQSSFPADAVASLIQEISEARDCLIDQKTHERYAGRLQGLDPEADALDARNLWRDFHLQFSQAWDEAQRQPFDAAHHWLGIPRHQRPASHYQLLGLAETETNAEIIRSAAERQIAFVRSYAFGPHGDEANRLLSQLARAKSFLLRTATADHDGTLPYAADEAQVPTPVGAPIEAGNLTLTEPTRAVVAEDGNAPTQASPGTTRPALDSLDTFSTTSQPQPVKVRVKSRKSARKRSVFSNLSVFVLPLLAIGLMITTTYVVIQRVNEHLESKRQPAVDLTAFKADIERFLESNRVAEAQGLWQKLESDYPDVASLPELSPTRMSIERAAILQSDAGTPSSNALGGGDAANAPALPRIDDEPLRVRPAPGSEVTLEERRRREMDLNMLERQFETLQNRYEAGTPLTDTEGLAKSLESRFRELRSESEPLEPGAFDRFNTLQSRLSAFRIEIAANDGPSNSSSAPRTTPDPNASPGTFPTPFGETQQEAGKFVPDYGPPEKWTMKSGRTFQARITNMEKEQVTFEQTSDEQRATIDISDMAAEDRARLLRRYFDIQDAWQLHESRQYLQQINSNADGIADVLEDAHERFDVSPYAGLWCAICMSEGRNDVDAASRILVRVISRIEAQQEIDPSRHRMTLAAAYNNLAICKLKDQQFDTAGKMFASAVDALPIPSDPVLHNTRLLRKLNSGSTPVRRLNDRIVSRLGTVLKAHASHQTALTDHWYYCLDATLVDEKSTPQSPGTRSYLSQDSMHGIGGLPLVRNTWCLLCRGAGSHRCQYGNCVNGSVTVQRSVQVSVNVAGEPIYAPKNFKQTCPNCGGAGKVRCTACVNGRVR